MGGAWPDGPPKLGTATGDPTAEVPAMLIYPPSPSDEVPISLVKTSPLSGTEAMSTRVEVSGTGVESCTRSSSSNSANAVPVTPPRSVSTPSPAGVGCATI